MDQMGAERLSHWFLLGSLLLHLGLALLLVKGLPVLPWADYRPEEPGPPLVVTMLDPDAVNELAIGPTTHLPPKPKNLVPAPRSRLAPQPRTPAAPEWLLPKALLPEGLMPPARDGDAVRGDGQPSAPAPPPGLPFVSREEIDRLAKLFTDQPARSKEPYQVNTEDLQYLSYIAQIARHLELVWRYPKEAGDRGQQGVTVLKVTITEDGTLHAAQLIESSGYPLLDGEALRAVKRIAPYPPLPASWHRSEWELTISFTYQLYGVAVSVI